MNRYFSSVVIVSVLALQILTGFLWNTGGRAYPFVAYRMYSKATPGPPINIEKSTVTLISRNGKNFSVSQKWTSRDEKEILNPLRKGDPSGARKLAEQFKSDGKDTIVAVQLDIETYVYTDSVLNLTSKRTQVFNINDSSRH